MKFFLIIISVTAIIIIGTVHAMAIEEVKYKVVKKDNHFEVRDYSTHIVAETVVEENMEDAGNIAFKKLFGYISGDNRSRDKISMTAPVSQQKKGEKIKMTAPVTQAPDKDSWVVSFMMPSGYTMETLPAPENLEVTLRQIPARRMAVVGYSGFWSEKGYLRYKAELESWIHRMGFTAVGVPIWARYNPPFMPWFLRRNEILIPIDVGSG
ncbi:conserved hypothetical protein [Desulforapulum autotrophicum HRM2]|uniref:Heme-binding protein n=1 Tax=Desulforapulum autotrophicum (strain ATCC 43914 / DSM 3382 / VKM B-1955 / HRM2) TaxID=177437 RepID=C0QBL7_DESAH|nr:heme-binding protein [Desulforapulum autotrophicum]ACN17019.1 conserved hypothetical protein [Desulforapulum autotrophicum HRM2]